MNIRERRSQAQVLILVILSAFIGSADATGPQQMSLNSGISALPAPLNTVPQNSNREPATPVTDRKPSLLPTREPHEGTSADLFAGHSWYTPPPPAPAPVRQQAKPVTRAPTAPALPYSYIGSFEQDGNATRYYLVKGDRVYDVKIGDVVDGMYSVDSVSNGQLMFTYLPLTSSQGLRLGD